MKFREFELDAFQEQAVHAIEDNHSVLVSAPTGSGKTLIADYIIDRDIKEGKRIIYTAPIKALSNQKYLDFVEQYGEDAIGIITGDTVINARAQVLVMTTEIYRNMAVVKDEALNTLSYVIFDEIHYINDEERGYIWEESIIFSSPEVRFVFLSATIPNAAEFAAWVRSIKGHEVSVISHHHRPVPLQTLFYDSEFGLVDSERLKELDAPDYYSVRGGRQQRQRRERPAPPQYTDLLRELYKEQRFPCIYFVFSRLKTQQYATRLAKVADLLTHAEKKVMSSEIAERFGRLSKEVVSLNSSVQLRYALSKGMAFHHAGMLPDTKHIVEQLFAKGLIKVLFATETFAVGINMPAKTVCFDSLRKFTGQGFRYVNSKEFFQISGRAGRRGKDDYGLSISLITRPRDDIGKILAFTKEDTMPIKSQFKITYNTVLNMVNLHNPEEINQILSMNFYTFQKGQEGEVMGAIQNRYDNLIKELTKLGYIEDGQLTELGHFTTKIFSNELEVSQIFGGGFGMELDEYAILLVLGALVYEERRDMEFKNKVKTKTGMDLYRALRSHPVLKHGEWYKSLEELSAIIHPLTQSKKFIEILGNTTMLEGDLIRFYMQVLDKLEQLDRALQDELMIQKIRACKQLLRSALEGIHIF